MIRMVEFGGRALLASLFVLGGLNKILTYQNTLDSMVAAGLHPAGLLLPATIALEMIGGLCLMFGRLTGAVAAVALAGFTLVTNVIFHRFWELDGRIAELELSLFFKNVSIAGGLVVLAAFLWSRHRASYWS